jgi:hypothetical protein
MAQQLRESIDKWEYMKCKTSAQHEMASELNKRPIEWEKIFTGYTYGKGLKIRYTGSWKN